MARTKVTIAKTANRVVVREDQNRFDPVLYSNLCIPSYVHGYSLAIEYMKKWFLSKMPENYFKYIHINGKHMFDDYKRWNKQNVKREKPYLVITPNVEFDHDREGLDLYNAGADIFLKKSDFQRSFFRDTVNNYYLGMQMQELKMNFNFRIRVGTRAEQLDLFKRMELLYRVGGTQAEEISADFPLPADVILNLAKANGFKMKADGTLEEPIKFLNYLNNYSDLPITYKLRTINSKFEFFVRLNRLYTHIATLSKLQLDDGEREGQMDTNFAIDMECVLRLPITHFFVFYNEKPLEYSINIDNSRSIDMYSLPFFEIPEEDENGWQQVINTSYLLDLEERSIDLTPIFAGTNLGKVMEHCVDNFISPKCFMSITFYRLEIATDKYIVLPTTMNYETKVVELNDDTLIDENIYIAIYADKSFINSTITSIENLNDNRISSNKIDLGGQSISDEEIFEGRGTVKVQK